MPLSTLLPEGTGTLNQFTSFGTRPGNVRTRDDGASYVWYRRDIGRTDRILMEDLSPAAASVSLVQSTARYQHSSTGSGTQVAHGFFESVGIFGTYRTTGGWVDSTDTHANHPSTNPWTVANVNSVNLTVTHNGTGGSSNAVEITYYAGKVTWGYGGGASATFLTSLVGPLLGVCVPLSAMARISQAMGRTRLAPEEYRPHWEALRAYTWPVQFDMAA